MQPVSLKDIIACLENFAPLSLQESYDNSGLLTGNENMAIQKALLCLDATEAVIDEAIATGCNLVIAHHPIVFSGLKKLNGKNYVERVIIKAIKNDIAIYAIHTNLDNVRQGVNAKIAEKLGLQSTQILQPKKQTLKKLFTFIPTEHLEKVQEALFTAGAGHIGNYEKCSFYTQGNGTFQGNKLSNPTIGKPLKFEKADEVKLEVIFPAYAEKKVIQALMAHHPYETPAYDIIAVEAVNYETGSGLVGTLPKALMPKDFLQHVKTTLKAESIRYTAFENTIQKVALCGGSGSFLLPDAIKAGAQAFITGDFKYHQFFDAENQLMIADIGHFESEQFTPEIIQSILSEKFPTFATLFTKINTNPINYF